MSVIGVPFEKLSLKKGGLLRFYDQSETYYVGLRGPNTGAASNNSAYALPAGLPPLTGYVLACDTSGIMTWVAQTGGVPTTRQILGGTSLAGGGDLSADRTLTLLNDQATPGPSRYYGTNSSGAKGFYGIPTVVTSSGGVEVGQKGSTFGAGTLTLDFDLTLYGTVVTCEVTITGARQWGPYPPGVFQYYGQKSRGIYRYTGSNASLWTQEPNNTTPPIPWIMNGNISPTIAIGTSAQYLRVIITGDGVTTQSANANWAVSVRVTGDGMF